MYDEYATRYFERISSYILTKNFVIIPMFNHKKIKQTESIKFKE